MPEPFYDSHSDEYFAQTVGVDLADLRGRFTALMPPGGSLCDAGCGSGRDAKAFADQGFAVTAFDASLPLVERARAHTGLPVAQLTFAQIAYQEAFDGIWACSSLIHVPAAEERGIFGKFVRALKPGGVWFLCYKVGEGEGFDGQRFFRYHTEPSLRRLLEACPGLDVVETWETTDRMPGRQVTWLNALCRKQTTS